MCHNCTMTIVKRISEELTAAMKARDEVAKRTLRMVKADLMKREAELGRALADEEALAVLASAVKSRRDSIAEYEKAERSELASSEREEVAVIARYLPAQLDEAAARAAIEAIRDELGLTERRQMGELMKAVMQKHRGTIDGKLASTIAREILG